MAAPKAAAPLPTMIRSNGFMAERPPRLAARVLAVRAPRDDREKKQRQNQHVILVKTASP
jgi:hypothetical protein